VHRAKFWRISVDRRKAMRAIANKWDLDAVLVCAVCFSAVHITRARK
jgi:hypothetical protein